MDVADVLKEGMSKHVHTTADTASSPRSVLSGFPVTEKSHSLLGPLSCCHVLVTSAPLLSPSCAGSSRIPCRLDPCPRPLPPLCLWASPTAFLLTDSSAHTTPFCVSQVMNGKPSPAVPILHRAPPACRSRTILLRSTQSTGALLFPDCLTLVSFCFLLWEHLSPHLSFNARSIRPNPNLTLMFFL